LSEDGRYGNSTLDSKGRRDRRNEGAEERVAEISEIEERSYECHNGRFDEK
jgi:hypothetical protein